MVGFLLQHKAKQTLYGGRFDNPLQVASMHGSLEIARRLLQAGSDVNRVGGIYGTVLYAACKLGKVDVVRLLLEHHADPNIQECEKCDNALQVGLITGWLDPDLVALLTDNGANINLHGGLYDSALHAAFCSGNEEVVRVLLSKGADVCYKGNKLGTILQAAVYSGNEAVVSIALHCGTSANEKGGEFTYPLIRAVAEAYPDSIVLLLLQQGANPNLVREGDDDDSKLYPTALQSTTSTSKATMLLDHGAQINTVAGLIGTALHAAVAHIIASTDFVMLCISRRADIDKIVGDIGSPICLALEFQKLDQARILTEAGANLDCVDTVGHSALQRYTLACEKPDLNILDHLISLGSDPLLTDQRGCNCLHYAARANNLDVLRTIDRQDVNISMTDRQGWTPLHWGAASSQASSQVVKFLLDQGCDRHLRDQEGRTALDLAVIFGKSALVAILEAEGKADVDVTADDELAENETWYYNCDGCRIVRRTLP